MKRVISLLLATALLSFCLSGCRQKGANSQTWDSRSMWIKNASSEQGFYFMGEERLHFFDPASKKTAALCDKTGCSHTDETCQAYFFTADPLFFRGDKLYYISFSENGYELMRRDADGRNVEKVFSFFQSETEDGQATWQFSDYKMSQRYFYYSALKEEDPTVEKEDNRAEYSVRRVDLEKKIEEELFRKKVNSCTLTAVNDFQVIFTELDVDPSFSFEDFDMEQFRQSSYMKIFLWEEGQNAPQLLMEGSRNDLSAPVAAVGDSLFLLFYQEGSNAQVMKRINLRSGEIKDVCYLEEVNGYSVLEENYLLVNNEHEKRLFRYSETEFQEIPNGFLPAQENILSVEATVGGFVVGRITEKVKTGADFYQSKAMAYSFISQEDAEQGKQNYTDFYTETFD